MKTSIVMCWVLAVLLAVAGTGTGAAADEVADRRQELALILKTLSKADRAILLQGVQSTKSELMTEGGSANDLLWSQLAKWGYMREVSETGRMAQSLAAMGLRMKRFSVTKAGQVAIPQLLE